VQRNKAQECQKKLTNFIIKK